VTSVGPPAPLAEYYETLSGGSWRGFDALWHDPREALAVRAAVAGWVSYHERPRAVRGAGDTVAVQSDFSGAIAGGTSVSFATLTLFQVDGDRIRRADRWHQPADTDRHLEIPAIRAVLGYFDAANSSDWDAFEQVWALDGELVAVGGPSRHGRDDVVRAYRRFLALFASYHDHVDRLVINGRSVTVTGHLVASSQGGAQIELDWIDQIDLDEEHQHIQRLSHWHDRDVFSRMMFGTHGRA
jgi:SnoaL-like protein